MLEMAPNKGSGDVKIKPPTNSSWPKRFWLDLVLKATMGLDRTSTSSVEAAISDGAKVKNGKATTVAVLPTNRHKDRNKVDARKGLACTAHPAATTRRSARVLEQCSQLFRHGARKFIGIHDRDRTTIVARHIMSDADGQQFHG